MANDYNTSPKSNWKAKSSEQDCYCGWNASTPLEARLAYARCGKWTFASLPNTRISYKAARHNGGERWGATTNLIEIERDHARWPNANVCIVTGVASGLFVVDCDTAAHGEGVDGEAALRRLIRQYGGGEWPVTRQALSPSGSRHYYFQWPAPIHGAITIRNSTGSLGEGIDVRGEGGMVVAPPSVRKDGKYCWANDAAIAPAPVWLLGRLMEPVRPRPTNDEGERVHGSLVAETMKHVPCELNWHERNNIGMAIWSCTGGSPEGLLIWQEWLQRSGRYNAAAAVKRWDAIARCPPNNIGYGTLSYLATKANPQWWNEFEVRLLADLNK